MIIEFERYNSRLPSTGEILAMTDSLYKTLEKRPNSVIEVMIRQINEMIIEFERSNDRLPSTDEIITMTDSLYT